MKFIKIEQVDNGFILTGSDFPMTEKSEDKDKAINSLLDRALPFISMVFQAPPPPEGEEWKEEVNQNESRFKPEDIVEKILVNKPIKKVFKNLASLLNFLDKNYNPSQGL